MYVILTATCSTSFLHCRFASCMTPVIQWLYAVDNVTFMLLSSYARLSLLYFKPQYDVPLMILYRIWNFCRDKWCCLQAFIHQKRQNACGSYTLYFHFLSVLHMFFLLYVNDIRIYAYLLVQYRHLVWLYDLASVQAHLCRTHCAMHGCVVCNLGCMHALLYDIIWSMSVWWLMGVVLMYIVVYEVFVCILHFYSEAMHVLWFMVVILHACIVCMKIGCAEFW